MHFKKLSIFLSILSIIIFSAACSSKDDNPAGNNGNQPPQATFKTVTVPQNMQNAANNNNPGASIGSSMLNLANSISSYSAFFTPPQGINNKISKTNEEWTWNDGEGNVIVLTATGDDPIHWVITLNGVMFIEAQESKDGSQGWMNIYDPESSATIAIQFTWSTDTNGTFHFTMVTSDVNISITANVDGSGNMTIQTSDGKWEVSWNADGSGSYTQYDGEGGVVDQGSWP